MGEHATSIASFPNDTFQTEIKSSFELWHTLTMHVLDLFWECNEIWLPSCILLHHKHAEVHYTHPQIGQLLNWLQRNTHPNKVDSKDIHGLDHSGGSGPMTTKQARLIGSHDFTWEVPSANKQFPTRHLWSVPITQQTRSFWSRCVPLKKYYK